MHVDLVLETLEQALRAHGLQRDIVLVDYSDRGSQYVSIRHSERFADAGTPPSVGSRSDSGNKARAETINALYIQGRADSSLGALHGSRSRRAGCVLAGVPVQALSFVGADRLFRASSSRRRVAIEDLVAGLSEIPKSWQISDVVSPSSSLATNRSRSSMAAIGWQVVLHITRDTAW
jgi:transposase InsO family protein